MKIGFIGIGRMGSRMAARLLAAGHALAVYDANRAACASLVERGAKLCASPGEVARASDVVLTSLPGPEEVAEVLEGVLADARKGSLVIETSTIGPAQSRALAKRCAALGLTYVDAPVSNGLPAAEAGELTIMVGGTKEEYERTLPVLSVLGNHVYHMGPTGSGNIAKLSNQVIYLSYVAVFLEIAKLGRGAGLDVEKLVDVMRHSVAGSPLMTHWEERIMSGDRKAGFAIERLLKDMDLCGEIFSEERIAAPVFDSARDTYREVAEAGGEHLDMTAIYDR